MEAPRVVRHRRLQQIQNIYIILSALIIISVYILAFLFHLNHFGQTLRDRAEARGTVKKEQFMKTITLKEANLIDFTPKFSSGTFNDSDESFIAYQPHNPDNVKTWVKSLDDFLEPYRKQENTTKCEFNMKNNETVCEVPYKFDSCTRENYYGYNSSSPCVFLKWKPPVNWKPKSYTDIIPEMPSDLKTQITQTPQLERDRIWVSCSSQDKHIVSYVSTPGFSTYFYSSNTAESDLEPLIVIKVHNLEPDVMVTIRCKIWAQNIIDSSIKQESGEIQILMF